MPSSEVLTPSVVRRDQIFAKATLGGSSQPRLHLFKVEFEMRSLPVGLQGRLVLVHFIEIEAIWVIAVLDNIEAKTAGLILLRMLRIMTNDFEKLRNVLRFYLHCYLQN
jgi:hypothetical protein